jgi:lipopolysaccharide export LptBFGC system permease protein LptF
MSRTLFWYIFRDLLRIFFMASGALAGIMSFGGLLRPLTHQGLDAGQVGRMLSYLTPAMTTYSLPVAALFATTMVYGRLSADNELTAARASGMSLVSLSVAGPAMVLGLVVALMSLIFLCFIVPFYTLKVEQVLYSNLAKLIQTQIEQTHELQFAPVFAQSAYIPRGVPAGQQQVVLINPAFITVNRPDKADPTYRVPKEFYTADRAIIYIQQHSNDDRVDLTVKLTDGLKFPREFLGATDLGISATDYGPIQIDSPIKEDTKFMNVWRLKEVFSNPASSRRIQAVVNDFVARDQKIKFLQQIADNLNGPARESTFNFEDNERYIVERDANAPLARLKDGDLVCGTEDGGTDQPFRFVHGKPGYSTTIKAHWLRLIATPDDTTGRGGQADQINVSVEMRDCLADIENAVPQQSFTQQFSVPMSDEIKALASRGLDYWESPAAKGAGDQQFMNHEVLAVLNSIVAESAARLSFAISCLILVMVGCALGMMFRSGNFLTAFAVSFVPALLTITLIIAGQRIAGNVPLHFDMANRALQTGMALIWTGNAVNLVLASVLLLRLHQK